MRIISTLLAVLLLASPGFAQQSESSIRRSVEKAAAAAAVQATSRPPGAHKGKLFWPGIVVGVAGATTSVLGLTALRVEDSSSGGAPKGAYRACVAEAAANPVYRTSDCDALKGKNLKLLWGGAAVGVLGSAMVIGSLDTSAEVGPGAVRFFHRIRF